MTVHFVKTEEIAPLARKVFEDQRRQILQINPNAEINHIGASSVPGSITSGDLDIQIGVTQENFTKTMNGLKDLYDVQLPDLWTKELALFNQRDHPEIPLDIILCVSNSKYDEYTQVRDLLKNNPDILKEYNDLKQQYEGKKMSEYKQAKEKMFSPNGNCALLEKYKDRFD